MENNNEDKDILLLEKEMENNQSLSKYLTDNIHVILRIIKKFPRNKKKKELKVLENGMEISDTAYKTLSLHIQKKFPDYKVTPKLLSSMLTRVKKKLGMEIKKTKRSKDKNE